MNPSLAGSQMSKEASSEQSSVCKEAGYDEVFGSSHEPKASPSHQRGKHQPNLLTKKLEVMEMKVRKK